MSFSPICTIGSLILGKYTKPGESYKVDNFPEILSTVDVRTSQQPLQGEHGVYQAPSLYGARTLAFSGEIVAPSQTTRLSMENTMIQELRLAALQGFADGSDGQILVKFDLEDGKAVQCYARVIQAPQFSYRQEFGGRHRVRVFSFALLAKDPNLYSQSLQSASGTESFEGTNFTIVQGSTFKIPFQLYQNTPLTATVTNAGNHDAPPVITITGPTTSPKITNVTTGKLIVLTGLTLTAGQSVVIDVNKRTIKRNDGTDLSGYFGSGSSWWVLGPGSNSITFVDATQSQIQATAQIQWRDTYHGIG